MIKFKGTKGKWMVITTICPDTGIDRNYEVSNIVGRKEISTSIAECWGNWKVNKNIFLERQEAKANALLISKAPEMLEMLQDFMQMYRDYDMTPEDELWEYADKVSELIKEATEL